MMDHHRPLDLDAVRCFVLASDLASFTRAAALTGTTQSAISLKLKKLEERLGVRLLDRTPRLVQPTAAGMRFLAEARALLAAHDRALHAADAPVLRLRLGVSDHVAGPDLPQILAHLAQASPHLQPEVRIGLSSQLLDQYDQGGLDVVLVRREGSRRDGELVREDQVGWFARPDWPLPPGPLPLACLAPPCGIRAQALRALDDQGLPWREVLVGGGIQAVVAAAQTGLAVAPLAARIAPADLVDIGPAHDLPPQPWSHVMLYGRLADPATRRWVEHMIHVARQPQA